MNRRDFNRFLLAIPTLKSSDLVSDPSDKKDVTIDLSAYSKALLPMEHGRLVDLKGYYGSYRYPSRDQSMQFMAFFNGVGGLYVQTMDENIVNVVADRVTMINILSKLMMTHMQCIPAST